MRIHTHDAQSFIQSLAASIRKDPASMENWRCLHVPYRDNRDAEWYEKMLNYLQQTNKDLDCEVVLCADDDLLFISRHLQVDELYDVAHMFILATSDADGKAGDVALYDLFRDWRVVHELLVRKEGEPLPYINPVPTHTFGDVAALQDVFDEAKKRRSVRHPLHVMVVEDDLLTRRIVTNAFKENYALITAGDAQEAVANYLLHAPDIVFLDIGLPDATGFDVLHQIIAADRDAYVVMFSGNSYLDNVTHALAQGASGFVAKPFKHDKMRHYILESAHHHHKHCS